EKGQTTFKFYASGRRYCQGLLATLELKSRHDLIARIYNMIVPCRDEIAFEVYMNDDAMNHVVFAMAKKKAAKAMHKDVRDLQRFGSVLSPLTSRKWVADDLAVISESKEVAADLITDAVIDQRSRNEEVRGCNFFKWASEDNVDERDTTIGWQRRKIMNLEKSLLRGRAWTTVDERGQAWTSVDERGRAWTSVDERGRAWTSVDERGQPWTTVDERGRPWTSVDERGRPWTTVDKRGRAWTTVDERGRPWTTVNECGRPWTSVPLLDAERPLSGCGRASSLFAERASCSALLGVRFAGRTCVHRASVLFSLDERELDVRSRGERLLSEKYEISQYNMTEDTSENITYHLK
ncbi:hypothetical protein LR48_Vigan11g090300, partial [Vigna angularis]